MTDRKCAHCATPLPADADHRKLYCDRKCKMAFTNLNLSRGAEVLSYLQVWRKGKNAKTPEAKALASYAFRELCSLADTYNAADKLSGRDPSKLLAPRLERGELSADRKPKAAAKLARTSGPRRPFAPAAT